MSYWAGHNCMVSSSLCSVPLSNRSFSSGIQQGKVWHSLGTNVTHGEVSAIANPGTMPSWKSRELDFLVFSTKEGSLGDTVQVKKMPAYTLFRFGVWTSKIKLISEFSKTPFEEKSHIVLNCKRSFWFSDSPQINLPIYMGIVWIMNCFLESQLNNCFDLGLQRLLITWYFMWFLWARMHCNKSFKQNVCVQVVCAIMPHRSLPHSLNNIAGN